MTRPPRLAAAVRLGLVAATCLWPLSAPRAEPVLRAAVTVASDLVTIGDFFEDAGPLADRAIFRAPDLGTTGTVPAWRVVAEARAAGLVGAREGNLVEVAVTRGAREIGTAEILALLSAALARQLGIADPAALQIALDQPVEPKLADARSADPVRVASVGVVPGQNRFEALVVIDRGLAPERLRLRGVATEMVETLTLTRPVARGEVIGPDDVAVERVPRRQAGAARGLGPDEIVGLAARRSLRAGQPLSISDFTKPMLVQRGETITLVYESPGLVLTARGQALDQGALGQSVSVLNQQSRRTVIGTVSGPGRVTIGGRTPVASLGRVQQ